MTIIAVGGAAVECPNKGMCSNEGGCPDEGGCQGCPKACEQTDVEQ